MNRILVAGLLISVMAFSGCASVPSKGRRAVKKTELYEHTETFVELDKQLVKKLILVEEKTAQTSDGRLIVNKTFLNNSKDTMRLQVQTVFKDANNAVTGDETNWELILVPAHAYYYYQATAMNEKARLHVTRCRVAQ